MMILIVIDSSPSLKSLHIIKWNNDDGSEEVFCLTKRVSTRWKDIGILLGLESNELTAIERDIPLDTGMRWNKVMECWLEGCSSEYFPTWEGLYALLNDIECSEIAIKLEDAVNKALSS